MYGAVRGNWLMMQRAACTAGGGDKSSPFDFREALI